LWRRWRVWSELGSVVYGVDLLSRLVDHGRDSDDSTPACYSGGFRRSCFWPVVRGLRG